MKMKDFLTKNAGLLIGAILGVVVIKLDGIKIFEWIAVIVALAWLGNYFQYHKENAKLKLMDMIDKLKNFVTKM